MQKLILWGGITALLLIVGYGGLYEPSPPATAINRMPQALPSADRLGGGASLVIQHDDPGLAEVGARWYFNRSHVPHAEIALEFVPLVCGYPGDGQVSAEHLNAIESAIRANPPAYPDGTLFLVGNEIGYRHQKDGRTARDYAEDFARCYTLLKAINPTFQVSVGPTILSTDPSITSAIVEAEDGSDYLRQVIAEYETLYGETIPAEYFAATNHVMRADAAGLQAFTQRIVAIRSLLAEAGLRERSLILTEFGVPVRGSSAEMIELFMAEAVQFAATATDPAIGHPADGKLIQRWAWFTARPLAPLEKLQPLGTGAFFLQLAQTSLYDSKGDLTHLGEVYRALMAGESEAGK